MHDVGRARSWYKDANKIADMAQSVERVLGKDEVTSSNLVISSKKTDRQSRLSVFFVLIFATLLQVKSTSWVKSLRDEIYLR